MFAKFGKQHFNTMDELLQFTEEHQLDKYNGLTAGLLTGYLHTVRGEPMVVTIKYDDIKECVQCELILKAICQEFTPTEIKGIKKSSISVTYELKETLNKLKNGTESYETVMWRLILEYKENHQI